MTSDRSIIGLAQWLQTPPGRYLLAWEQMQLDGSLGDLFGFHALQIGLPELDALRSNRMPHRWLAIERDLPTEGEHSMRVRSGDSDGPPAFARHAEALHCDYEALPFPSNSLDLVVLPHALELARDPHQTLREVERVLVPEGRVVIVGLNPASLWGLRQRVGRMRRGVGLARDRRLFMPPGGEFLNYWRLRDWLRLLSFDIERGRFGCYRPPLTSQRWLDRWRWTEAAGDRWWPVFGAVYFLVAVKRVRGMRLVGLAKRERTKPQAAPAVVANRQQQTHRGSER